MTKLWHAFLELPTWQGIALITSAIIVLVAVALLSGYVGYLCGAWNALAREDGQDEL